MINNHIIKKWIIDGWSVVLSTSQAVGEWFKNAVGTVVLLI